MTTKPWNLNFTTNIFLIMRANQISRRVSSLDYIFGITRIQTRNWTMNKGRLFIINASLRTLMCQHYIMDDFLEKATNLIRGALVLQIIFPRPQSQVDWLSVNPNWLSTIKVAAIWGTRNPRQYITHFIQTCNNADHINSKIELSNLGNDYDPPKDNLLPIPL